MVRFTVHSLCTVGLIVCMFQTSSPDQESEMQSSAGSTEYRKVKDYHTVEKTGKHTITNNYHVAVCVCGGGGVWGGGGCHNK